MRETMKGRIIAGLFALTALAWGASDVSAEERTFIAKLSPVLGVVHPTAQGIATFRLSEDGAQLAYELIVERAGAVVQAHIHLTMESTTYEGEHTHLPLEAGDGRMVVYLLDVLPDELTEDEIVVEGVITRADLRGPFIGQSLRALIDHMDRGQAYVNIHVRQELDLAKPPCCPPGVRGIIEAVGSSQAGSLQ
jgi:hypothetical protein